MTCIFFQNEAGLNNFGFSRLGGQKYVKTSVVWYRNILEEM